MADEHLTVNVWAVAPEDYSDGDMDLPTAVGGVLDSVEKWRTKGEEGDVAGYVVDWRSSVGAGQRSHNAGEGMVGAIVGRISHGVLATRDVVHPKGAAFVVEDQVEEGGEAGERQDEDDDEAVVVRRAEASWACCRLKQELPLSAQWIWCCYNCVHLLKCFAGECVVRWRERRGKEMRGR